MNIFHIKLYAAVLIFVVAIFAGWWPFHKRIQTATKQSFPMGEALATGVFLGAGLIHMLGDASKRFLALGHQYPFAFLIAGMTFLFMLWLEHLGQELYQNHQEGGVAFAVLAVIMLSFHSFLAGSALGLSSTLSILIVVLLAILAHKWAAGFALAVQINKSAMTLKMGFLAYLIFAIMTPLGVIIGDLIIGPLHHFAMIEPIFESLAAGTFLYLGTLHGLKRAVMVQQCCNLSGFTFVIIGFVLMAMVAIWT